VLSRKIPAEKRISKVSNKEFGIMRRSLFQNYIDKRIEISIDSSQQHLRNKYEVHPIQQ
jgi:hypothetical protein